MTMLLVLGLAVFAAGGAYAASGHLGLAKGHRHAKKHAKKKHHGRHHNAITQPTTQNVGSVNGENAAQNQYGTRPGKGCGDRNHVHTGPPGNPSNTACPPQSQHQQQSATKTAAKRHTAHHHSRSKHAKRHAKKH